MRRRPIIPHILAFLLFLRRFRLGLMRWRLMFLLLALRPHLLHTIIVTVHWKWFTIRLVHVAIDCFVFRIVLDRLLFRMVTSVVFGRRIVYMVLLFPTPNKIRIN